MINVEIDKRSMDALWDLRRRHREAIRALAEDDSRSAVTRMVAFVTAELGEAWEKVAPRLTGTLASATREQYFAGKGQVFIDPTVVNPILGGRPAVYGPVVHDRRPWVTQVYTADAPRVLQRAGELFFDEIREIYRK